ncbi:uncharacterized protein F4822DRAFT_434116 [Hypoxylon trugodes]|uniref:uncharacterized protein n=1 Tax=Hypoxylon trugodes TaxID=326681 RepID=UPI002196F193|nr:uncharacterized protein F4822DRAFT_434116 [Hypoxylon trugodes]KAI1384176.1 hypothetical protein F4822DRAFT_434116 [Hypoxylon trugodes]
MSQFVPGSFPPQETAIYSRDELAAIFREELEPIEDSVDHIGQTLQQMILDVARSVKEQGKGLEETAKEIIAIKAKVTEIDQKLGSLVANQAYIAALALAVRQLQLLHIDQDSVRLECIFAEHIANFGRLLKMNGEILSAYLALLEKDRLQHELAFYSKALVIGVVGVAGFLVMIFLKLAKYI